MVNLAFCRLDVPYPIMFWQFRSTTFHLFPFFHVPSAGRSFMLEFLRWSSKYIFFGAFQMQLYNLVICCSDFVFQERSSFLLIWGWISLIFDDHGSWFRFAGCFGIMMDFFKQPQASVQIEATWSIWTFWVLFDRSGRFCLLLCLCIILTWNPIDYHCFHLLLVVHQRIYCFCISSLCL